MVATRIRWGFGQALISFNLPAIHAKNNNGIFHVTESNNIWRTLYQAKLSH